MLLCWCEIARTDNSVQLVQFGNKCTSVSFIILCPRISHNSFAKIVSISQLMSSIIFTANFLLPIFKTLFTSIFSCCRITNLGYSGFVLRMVKGYFHVLFSNFLILFSVSGTHP